MCQSHRLTGRAGGASRLGESCTDPGVLPSLRGLPSILGPGVARGTLTQLLDHNISGNTRTSLLVTWHRVGLSGAWLCPGEGTACAPRPRGLMVLLGNRSARDPSRTFSPPHRCCPSGAADSTLVSCRKFPAERKWSWCQKWFQAGWGQEEGAPHPRSCSRGPGRPQGPSEPLPSSHARHLRARQPPPIGSSPGTDPSARQSGQRPQRLVGSPAQAWAPLDGSLMPCSWDTGTPKCILLEAGALGCLMHKGASWRGRWASSVSSPVLCPQLGARRAALWLGDHLESPRGKGVKSGNPTVIPTQDPPRSPEEVLPLGIHFPSSAIRKSPSLLPSLCSR